MTNEEIKKALEICILGDCGGCPYVGFDFGCRDKLNEDALALITEQEKDIKQLKTECALLDDELRNARQETINVLNKLKEKYGYYICYAFGCYICSLNEIIDEMIKEQLKCRR